jgi:hypothetical protein
MSLRLALSSIALLAFSPFTAYVLMQTGYVSLFEEGLASWGARQITVDLIAAVIAMGFIIKDARLNKLHYWPFFVVTWVLGSVGFLAYLVYRSITIRQTVVNTLTLEEDSI